MPDRLPRASHNKKTVGIPQLHKKNQMDFHGLHTIRRLFEAPVTQKNSIGSLEDRHFGKK